MGEVENGDNVGILVLEAKSLRPFKTKDEYLYAMKEDLAEWFTCLYKEITLDADNFFEVLETGVLLCQHANEVRKFASEQKKKGNFDLQSNFVRDIPQYDVQFRVDIKPGTFLARDNISNFITWTSKMGIPEVLRFETDDLVLRKNERSVVLCLLEVARVGAKFGMLAPTIVQMEEEIDNEIETGEPPPQIKTCDVKSLDEMVRELVGRCTCPRQFPIVKVGEGKYKIGDNQTLVFVRILRKHVMIRVGGGWDTLEHYLDRHDPCRCGFQGHRVGRGPSTPRKASTAATPSKSLPNTPKTPRKLSMTAPVSLNSTHSGNTPRPASPHMRSASPGPNSRKLSLTTKNSISQPGSSVTSPVISNKQTNFSKTGLNSSGKIESTRSGNTPRPASPHMRSASPGPNSRKLSLTTKNSISQPGSSVTSPVISNKQTNFSNTGLNSSGKIESTHSRNAPRPASPHMRSASPGPNSRKLSLTTKNSISQPGSSVTSPVISNKQPNFSNTGLNSSGKIQNNVSQQNGCISTSGAFPVGSFVKQSQLNLTRQLSTGSGGSQTTPSTPRAPSPGLRRSESPVPVIANRLRSPSPAPSNQSSSNSSRTQSVPATQRCSSPMKQITLSELRSSRDGKLTNQQQPQTTSQKVKRQTSTDSTKSRESESEMASESSNFTIDKISTMSLGEFKNLLNNALSVPNGNAESQCSSDSPRSQSSVDSSRNHGPPKQIKSTPTRSAYGQRSISASRAATAKSTSKPIIPTKPNLDSSSGYSSSPASARSTFSSPGSTKSTRSVTSTNTLTNGTGSRPPSRTVSNTSVRSAASSNSSNYGQERPKTPNSLSKSKSNTSSICDNSYQTQSNSKTTYASRSSSHSSLQSYESTDDGRNSLGVDLATNASSKSVLSPSSVDSDYSFRGSSGTSSDYARSNSYTPCSSAEDRYRLDKLRSAAGIRANSEPRDVQSNHVTEPKPLNVGYASFSYDNDSDTKDNELDEIENEIVKSRHNSEEIMSETKDSSVASRTGNVRPQTPSGRTTPSFIPRPVTPKISRKLSLPQNENNNDNEEKTSRTGRPPTPKKSNILARAHGAGVRSADRSKEQTYREIFQKRSTTPGPGSGSSNSMSNTAPARRSMTPGPYLNKTSTLRVTSATTNRARLNEALEKKNDPPLSVYTNRSSNIANGATKRVPSADRKTLTRQKSGEKGETVIMVNVDRSDNKHSLSVAGETEKRPGVSLTNINKAKVLARARTEDNRARAQARSVPGTPRHRPQSVEPRQLIPSQGLSVKTNVNGEVPEKYDRTQEWVQTAVEQTKVQKTKTPNTYTPKMRRAMTPNSFDMRIDYEKEEPRSLEEIKAALTLPLNGMEVIEVNPDTLDAPPEDPEMYATMEKLFHELRQQELKNSVNETPGSSTSGSKGLKTRSRSSISNSSTNDEELSLDSNKNVKRTATGSTKSSVVMSPPMTRANIRSQPPSRTSSISSNGVSQSSNYKSSQRDNQPGRAGSVTSKASSNSTSNSTRTSNTTRPSSPGPSLTSKRPPSPRTTSQPPIPASPRVTSQPPRPASPRVGSQPPRPASPRVVSQPPRPASPRISPHTSRPASPRTTVSSVSSAGSTPSRKQPPRPASTPPRASTPMKRQGSKSSDDSDVFVDKKSDSSGLLSKIKEIINVKPRKDKLEGVKQKSRIPAPKSLASVGKSRSFSNLTNLSSSMSLSPTDKNCNFNDELEMNGYGEHINGGLNVTLSGRSETPSSGPRWATPLTTGRSSLIRKESMEKNKNSTNRLSRAVSVERNMSGLNGNYQYYDEGEYV